MKTKIGVEIHKSGAGILMEICDLVGKHNSGDVNITPDFIRSYIDLERLKYSAMNSDLKVETIKDWELSISRDNVSPFITLTWKEIHKLELTEAEQNLVVQEFVS